MTDSPLASSEWAALVAAIRFAPDDDTARLVAAEWLDDTRRAELEAWAELVRVQVEAEHYRRDHVFNDGCACTGCRAERRTTLLFDRWGLHWHAHQFDINASYLKAAAGQYRRGFVEVAEAALQRFRVLLGPSLVADPFRRSPLLGLSAATYDLAASSREWARWVIETRLWRPTPAKDRPPHLIVQSVISPGRPSIRAPKNVDSRRIAWGRRQNLLRLIRATVRDVLTRRRESVIDTLTTPEQVNDLILHQMGLQ
jgi:uncharacterized protein (TIGR02996 family)